MYDYNNLTFGKTAGQCADPYLDPYGSAFWDPFRGGKWIQIRIRTLTRIKVKSREQWSHGGSSWSRGGSQWSPDEAHSKALEVFSPVVTDSHHFDKKFDLDPHQSERSGFPGTAWNSAPGNKLNPKQHLYLHEVKNILLSRL
jgi:hypothetical protein